ncbi:MAG: osmotically-inducible protein OsmY [Moritella sp.]|jgi:osmotically-inducible protein OsmY
MQHIKTLTNFALIVGALASLQGCAGLVAAGAITATTVASDSRTFSQQIDDEAITLDITARLNQKDKDLLQQNNLHILTTNNRVLLSGQVKAAAQRDLIVSISAKTESVILVYNQIRLGDPVSFEQSSKDSWLTTKVKTSMLEIEGLEPLSIKVITENAEVFLIGKVTRLEGDKAAEAARYVVGVNKVIKVFEYK